MRQTSVQKASGSSPVLDSGFLLSTNSLFNNHEKIDAKLFNEN